MNIRIEKIFFTILTAILSTNTATSQIDFGAYYTKINAGQDWESFSRTGIHADIVVKLSGSGGELVFWRGNSYLPVWKTNRGNWNFMEIIPRSGNGTITMPDKANVYSHAEIIKNTPAQIIIHWRYLSSFAEGNPHKGVGRDNFVEETFTITPDGVVKREVKIGTVKIDDWNDSACETTQILQLSRGGMKQISLRNSEHSLKQARVKGNPGKGPFVVHPSIWFSFDEGIGDSVNEKIHSIKIAVPGNKTLWKKGISGTALEFDGYNTSVSIPPVERSVALVILTFLTGSFETIPAPRTPPMVADNNIKTNVSGSTSIILMNKIASTNTGIVLETLSVPGITLSSVCFVNFNNAI